MSSSVITGWRQWKSKLLYDCRFTASQYFLARSPLRITTRMLYNTTLRSLCNILSIKRWVVLYEKVCPLACVRMAHMAGQWTFSFCTKHKSSISRGFRKQIMHILLILRYNCRLVTWTVVSSTTTKFKPLIFYMSGFALSYTANMFILMILYDFCLFPATFCLIIVYVRKLENCLQIADRCAPWRVSRRCTSKNWESDANSQMRQA
jgi:hypothetical protein